MTCGFDILTCDQIVISPSQGPKDRASSACFGARQMPGELPKMWSWMWIKTHGNQQLLTNKPTVIYYIQNIYKYSYSIFLGINISWSIRYQMQVHPSKRHWCARRCPQYPKITYVVIMIILPIQDGNRVLYPSWWSYVCSFHSRIIITKYDQLLGRGKKINQWCQWRFQCMMIQSPFHC